MLDWYGCNDAQLVLDMLWLLSNKLKRFQDPKSIACGLPESREKLQILIENWPRWNMSPWLFEWLPPWQDPCRLAVWRHSRVSGHNQTMTQTGGLSSSVKPHKWGWYNYTVQCTPDKCKLTHICILTWLSGLGKLRIALFSIPRFSGMSKS